MPGSDLIMPVMDGWEAIALMRDAERQRAHVVNGCRITITSGNAEGNDLENAVKRGADGYLLKPFVERSLRKEVARAIWSRPSTHQPM